ncbi:MAG: hybrid sensor histidine kinase/response regulator, partial [Kofleriaceae bacterium]
IALMAVGIGQRSPNDAHDVLPRIERANRAIGDLVARLQRVARPVPFESEPAEIADLRQVVDDIITMVGPILREQSIALELELPALPAVRFDPVTVHQIVLNLVLNAQDALVDVPADTRRLQVRATNDGHLVRLTVSDTGPGIAPEVLANMFQPFVTTKKGAHAGLGLAAAHASLMHLGGELRGYNAPGGGAVFELGLPVAPQPEPVAAERHHPSELQRSGNILAVDDDPDIVIIIRAYLEPLGYHVVSAAGADQAIDVAARQPFDLILCDVGMPKRSGLDVCRSLREAGYRGKLVLMTGWDSQTVKADRRAADCDTILKKPFLGTDLLQVIDSLLAS